MCCYHSLWPQYEDGSSWIPAMSCLVTYWDMRCISRGSNRSNFSLSQVLSVELFLFAISAACSISQVHSPWTAMEQQGEILTWSASIRALSPPVCIRITAIWYRPHGWIYLQSICPRSICLPSRCLQSMCLRSISIRSISVWWSLFGRSVFA